MTVLTQPKADAPPAQETNGELTPERVAAVKAQLVETDGEPMDSPWHRDAVGLLIEIIAWHLRGRTNFYVGGNMFIYFSMEQTRGRKFRGPDFFFADDVDGTRQREYWWVFEEEGRLPNVIVELLSPTTAKEDRTTKKDVYEQTFRTPEYYCYDPYTKKLEGWRLANAHYEPIAPNERGWLWSKQLGLWLGTWNGWYVVQNATWLRFYDAEGNLLPTRAEELERLAAEEKQRADALAAEVTRLKAELAAKQNKPD